MLLSSALHCAVCAWSIMVPSGRLGPHATMTAATELPEAHRAALDRAAAEHAAEMSRHTSTWSLRADEAAHPACVFEASDFSVATDVGVAYAGPDAASLRDGGLVHETSAPVLTAEECESLLGDVKSVIATREEETVYGSGQGDTLYEIPEVRKRVAHLADCPLYGAPWLRQKLNSTFFPMLSTLYGLDAESLAACDALVIGYDADEKAYRMPAHRDAALITINVALSEEGEYDGGGTLIEATHKVLRMERGHAAVARFLQKKGANLLIKNDSDVTCIDLAAPETIKGLTPIVEKKKKI